MKTSEAKEKPSNKASSWKSAFKNLLLVIFAHKPKAENMSAYEVENFQENELHKIRDF